MSPPAALPLWFGPRERPLLGFYHAGDPQAPRPCAVVLCYPFGHEYTAVYQAYRQLAEQLAAAGFSVLRFDYDGTGDSAGEDGDADRLPSWLASIGAAIATARECCGVDAVCLFGLRLGAMLAYLAAGEHACVHSLVLWAPSLTGKLYLREWRAMRLLKDSGGNGETAPALADGDEEAGGFLMTRQTVAALKAVDLRARPLPAGRRVLLLARDSLLGEQKLADHMKTHGADVDYRFVPGYDGLVVEPYNVVIPEAAFTEIVAHLSASYPPLDAAVQSVPVLPSQVSIQPAVRESTIRFGAGGALFGIVTEPEQPAAAGARPALVLLNTSVIHRVGPNRMYVPMARRWAAAGYVVLRFDVAGLGDSPLAGWQARQRMYEKDSVRDVRAAMDWLSAQRGVGRFVLVGLCSGAYLAFHSGLADPRVVTQVMLNPQTFAWKEGDSLDVGRKLEYKSFRFYMNKALQADTWSRLLRGQVHWQGILRALGERALKTARTAVRQRAQALVARVQDGSAPSEPSVLSNFHSLLERDVEVLLLYSQEDPGLDELSLHLGKDARRLRSHPRFRLELIDGPDHTFTPVWSQKRLEQTITSYLQQQSSVSVRQ